MTSFGDKIREYGQKKDTPALYEYVEQIGIDEIVAHMKSSIHNANFTFEWNYILQSLAKKAQNSHTKRVKLVLAVLKELDENDIPTTRGNELIQRICIDLDKFKSEHLIELCDYCNESLRSDKITQLSWKELLPEVLNVLVERDSVEYNDIEMTGLEYKAQFINALCMAQWSPNIVISLAAMFMDMPLTKEEHLQVVNKLGQYLEKLTPQEIPAFVYQLLKLCKHNNGRSVFLRLQNYFALRIYELPNFMDANSESTTTESIESANDRDIIDVESTVLYHIHLAASSGHQSIKDYLNSFRNVLRAPEFILHPFQLTVLMTISTLPYYEQKVFETVRVCISRTFNEEEKKNHSSAFREIVAGSCQIEKIFGQIINVSLNERPLVVQGLVNFAFVLLGVGSALGRDTIAEKQWNLGNMILLKIIKRKHTIASTIIGTLSNSIITGQNVSQYIECLYILSRGLPLLMLENQRCVEKLMEHLLVIPPSTSNQLLDALVPLTKVSSTIRDNLILILRKALYSKEADSRQMAVNGFLKLMTNLKISNMGILSQSSMGSFSSGHSLFTQMSINRSVQCTPSVFSNEALCLEVLGILRRCFVQQADVRSSLYDGLYDAVCVNLELGVPILDVVWLHFNNFYALDEEVVPPLKFNAITITKDLNVLLLEPLGKLILAMGRIVTKVAQKEDDNGNVDKFKNVLESLCKRMMNCELVHLELDDGSDLSDILPSCQQKVIILKEAMRVYEALIGYKICSWSPESERYAQDVNNLFQGYSRLIHFSKNLSKPKKAGGKKKKLDDTSTQEPSTQTKKDSAQKESNKAFKIPDTVLDFSTVCKALHLLLDSEVEWTSVAQANTLRCRKEIHQHFIHAAIRLVHGMKSKKVIDVERSKKYYNHLLEIADTLYNRVIKRLSEFIDFDCLATVMGLECFLAILNIICAQYRSNLSAFLNKICDFEKDDAFLDALKSVITTYQKLFEMDDARPVDSEYKKLDIIIINTLAVLCNQIPQDNNALSLQMMDWLKNVANNNILSSKQVVSAFITLLFDTHTKFKVSLTLYENMSVSLGNVIGLITEEEKQSEQFSIMDEAHVSTILQCFCASIKSILEIIDWMINRLKSEYYMISYPGTENMERKKEYLKSKERSVCCQLCFIVSIMSNVCNMTVPAGTISELVMKSLSQLFCTLGSLTKYFLMRSTKSNAVFQGARFEHLVKLTGKQLAPSVYKFILYIEESQKDDTDSSTQNRKKKKNIDTNQMKNKILRETRLIPKVVYEMEQFSKCIIQLSNKTKVDLSKFVGQGVVRDFRIVHLKEVLEKGGDLNETSFGSDTTGEENVAPAEHTATNDEDDETDIENLSGDEAGSSPAKRPRL